MDAAFGGAPFEGAGRSYPSGPLSPSYPSGSYRMRWKASRRSEGILTRSDPFIIVHHRSSIDEVPPKAVLPMDAAFGGAPFEGSGRSYPSGPLSPSYPCGNYHRGWKASRRSKGILRDSDPFIIVHHRSSINEGPGRRYSQWCTTFEGSGDSYTGVHETPVSDM
jgi:hypothetical protein